MDIFGASDTNKTATQNLYWRWKLETGSTPDEINDNDLLDSEWMGDRIVLGVQATGRQVMDSPETQYAVTFDLNGGTLTNHGDSTQVTKQVTYGNAYGNLPKPKRLGYIFKGWNGKNLLNLNATQTNISNKNFYNDTKRVFTPNTYVRGLAFNNYYNQSNVNSVEINNNSINLVCSNGYGIGFPILVSENEKYTLSYEAIFNSENPGSVYPVSSIMYYKIDGTYIGNVQTSGNGHISRTITTPADTYFMVIEFCASGNNTNATFSSIQLEEGNTATPYEAYTVVTAETLVTAEGNHTLTAIWEPIQ